ncbi:MAG: PorT family protein [Lentimicrobiaceae bacterium]|jgi:hypothetical protein|nr:PorT family protein [Lentimicrobiaceae bacterium]
MKKIFVITLFLLFLTTTVSAQYKSFQFGFHVSPNIGWMKSKSDNIDGKGIRMGFDWGFVGEFYIVENYALSTGFNVNFINTKYECGNDFAKIKRELNAQYIEIPLILKMKTNEIGGFLRIYGEVGYGLSFLLDAKANDKQYALSEKINSEEHRVYDELRNTRSALIIGAGVEVPIGGSTAIYGGIRFNNGFANVLKNQNINGREFNPKGSPNFLALKLGLLF